MNGALKVFVKEVRDFSRDKRVRNSAIRGPLITIVLMLLLFGFLISTISKPSNQKVTFVSGKGATEFASSFKSGGVQVETVPSLAEGERKLKTGEARVVLYVPDDFEAQLKQNKPVTFEEYFDPSSESSGVAKTYVEKTIGGINSEAVKAAFKAHQMNPELSEPMRLKPHEVTQGSGGVNQFLIGILPYLIIMWAFYGGLGAASELVAGEKEKFTLETLLITPVARRDIALGKLAGLALLCLLSPFMALVGLVATWAVHIPMMKPLFEKGLGITPLAIGQILIVLIPTVLLFASVLAAVSTRSRNVRECQTQLTLVSMLVIMPALFSQFIGYTEFARAIWISCIPVLNSATAVRQALSGEFHPAHLGLTVLVNLVLGIAAMLYTVSLFKKEEVLLRV
ncbi:MAG TPA: ABC transporter permease [Fimbriimonadaceae bacterium]|nr:ABC transporter permease [Fimbriimonadaceae bacterium]